MRSVLRAVCAEKLCALQRAVRACAVATAGRSRWLAVAVLAATVSAGSLAALGVHYFLSAPSSASPSALFARLGATDRAVAIEIKKSIGANASPNSAAEESSTPIETFYRARGFVPVWITQGTPDAKALSVVRYLASVDKEGLKPADYSAPDITAGMQPAALARYELALSSAVLKFSHDVRHGRVPGDLLGKNVGYDLSRPDQDNILTKIDSASRPDRILASLAPHQAGYLALKHALAALRAGDPALSILDARRKPGDTSVTDIIVANMERWRWMPRALGASHVIVNIPAFTLGLFDRGQELFKARIVVGKPSLPTPVMSQSISSITINPIWRVPQAMAKREYLPAMMKDPTVVERLGLKIRVDEKGILRFYQPAGENNVLGRVRINFPNKYLIYQHDTPDKFLFDLDVRTFSHGCMRVQDPVGYAAALLSISQPEDDYARARLRGLFSDEQIEIRLKTPIPVHLTYQTAFVDGAGRLVLRDDVYNVDLRMLAWLERDQRPRADRLADKR